MKLLSIEYIPGVEFEPLGIVKGTVVQTKNVGRDFMAGMKTLVGGEIVGYTEMLNEARQIATKRMVDEAKEMDADAVIGVKYLVMPYMAEEYRPVNPEGFQKFLPLLNEVGQKIHDAGMTFLYHNHDFEFVKLPDGQWGYDAMFDAIPHDHLMSELDTCWCDVATGEAPEFVRKYTDRIPVVHLKDYIKKGEVKNMYKLIGIETEEEEGDTGYFGFRPVGFGQMVWEPVLEAAIDANAKWVIVEQDEHYDMEPLECARRSREYLKILGW